MKSSFSLHCCQWTRMVVVTAFSSFSVQGILQLYIPLTQHPSTLILWPPPHHYLNHRGQMQMLQLRGEHIQFDLQAIPRSPRLLVCPPKAPPTTLNHPNRLYPQSKHLGNVQNPLRQPLPHLRVPLWMISYRQCSPFLMKSSCSATTISWSLPRQWGMERRRIFFAMQAFRSYELSGLPFTA